MNSHPPPAHLQDSPDYFEFEKNHTGTLTELSRKVSFEPKQGVSPLPIILYKLSGFE